MSNYVANTVNAATLIGSGQATRHSAPGELMPSLHLSNVTVVRSLSARELDQVSGGTGSGSNNLPVEPVTFNFGKIKWTYTQLS
ncbi:MAG TPA: hypothetical protein VMB34_32100 [Acetobacteraceae bacterium]|nr:hypothetical protein [Acetobacteraceae bacterium]